MMKKSVQEKIESLQKRLELYYKAEEKILSGQSYTIGSRSLTRADLGRVQDMIDGLEAKISCLKSRGTEKRRVVRVTPVD